MINPYLNRFCLGSSVEEREREGKEDLYAADFIATDNSPSVCSLYFSSDRARWAVLEDRPYLSFIME